MLFSIIVPAYQVENYIGQCIESLLPQCGKNCEIIIVDDGSNDRSGKIADDYARNYKCINVIHQINMGLSEARNTGITHAKGKYCVFVDGDDMLCEGAIGGLMKCIEDNQDAEVIIHRRKEIDSVGIVKECDYWFDEAQMRTLSISEVYRYLQRMPGLVLAGWLFSVRTDYIKKNKFFFLRGLLHEDEEWMPKILLNTAKIAYNNTCFYCYRVDREGSIMKTPNINKEIDKLRIIDLLEKEFRQQKYSVNIREVVEEKRRYLYCEVLSNACKYRKDEAYVNLLQLIKEKRRLLRDSDDVKHKVRYILMVFLGPRVACFCFWWNIKIKLMLRAVGH